MFETVISSAFYLFALINPASKVFFLCSTQPPLTSRRLWIVSLNASLTGLVILLVLAATGRFIFTFVFHVELYSIQIVGGIVLFTVGLAAIRKGRFFAQHYYGNSGDISIVPLAAPLIAGPGTITAVISFTAHIGLSMTCLAIFIAIACNFAIMVLSRFIYKTLDKFHAISPLVRIAGLVVAAVAVQMFLTGLGQWISTVVEDIYFFYGTEGNL